MFVSTGTTILKLVYPVCFNCIDLTTDYLDLYKNYTTQLVDDTEIIIYNIVYHMGLIYEDIQYLMGNDIFGDEIDPLPQDDLREKNYRIGQHIGDIFLEIFGRTGGYQYPYVSIDYPIEFEPLWVLDYPIEFDPDWL